MNKSSKYIFFINFAKVKNKKSLKCNLYNYRREDVNSFGTWYNSHFKVFVTENADKRKLCNELTSLNPEFFKEYIIKIETREIVVKLSMRQGVSILPWPPNENGKP